MSRDHATDAYEITNLVNEVNNMTIDDAKNILGLDINQDGSVFDPTYNMKFTSVGEWAAFSVEQEFTEYNENFH